MAEITLPRQWSDIKITGELGQGSFGTVYQATTVKGEKHHCAIKMISIPKTKAELQSMQSDMQNPASVEEYLQSVVDSCLVEIKTMLSLSSCPYIVSIYDYVVEKKQKEVGMNIFIRMELLTGLSQKTAKQLLTETEVIHLGMDLCKALKTCEEQHIIHRDVKPENIFYSETEKRYKLGDFGSARVFEQTTAAFSLKGTPHYMAPEVYKNQPYDSTVDIYSLGIVLYKLLNYNRNPLLPPHPNKITFHEQNKAFERRIAGETFPEPMRAHDATASVILKACSYKPKNRYQTADDFYAALEDLYNSLVRKNEQAVTMDTYAEESKVIDTTEEEKSPVQRKRGKGVRAFAAILSVVAILAGAWVFLSYLNGGIYADAILSALTNAFTSVKDWLILLINR